MIGKHEVTVRNARLQYKFTIERSVTILRGDSATGKTTLIDMLDSYQRNGRSSGVEVRCDKPCLVLTGYNWQMNLSQIIDSIVFIDEGDDFVRSKDFASAIQKTDNYYVIATRSVLPNISYSILEVYGIKNIAGNRYQGTKRLYSSFYPLHNSEIGITSSPDLVIVEDSNAGYEFFLDLFSEKSIPCISAHGKSNMLGEVQKCNAENILLIADGAAFGAEIDRILPLRYAKNIALFMPESFEWLILRSGLLRSSRVEAILALPADYIESREYFSWERFFTALLTEETRQSYLKYSKKNLNPAYLQPREKAAISALLPLEND